MPKYFCLILLFLFLSLLSLSQTRPDTTTFNLRTDSIGKDGIPVEFNREESDSIFGLPASPVFHAKSMNPDSVRLWRDQPQYRKAVQLDSLLKSIQAKELKNEKRGREGISLFTRFMNSAFLKIFLWTVAALFVLFILYQLIVRKGFFRGNRKQDTNVSSIDDEENRAGSDYHAMFLNAVQGKKYRLATRYLFLNSLQLLGEKGYLHIEPEKTNSAYRREMPAELKPGFNTISGLYEKIWYGNIEPAETQFRIVESQFIKFKSELN